MPRLNDTAALAKRPLRGPYEQMMDFGGGMKSVQGACAPSNSTPDFCMNPNPRGQFAKRTNAGPEGLSGAMEELRK